MALKKLRMICAGGDKTLAEWDTETVTQERLDEIEKEFNEKVAQGWFAADISDQEDYERAKDKARRLLRSIIPEASWNELQEKGVFSIDGKRGKYVISPYSQTEIRDLKTGRLVAYSCLQLSIPAPTYDRMVAEYLLIKNEEDAYWKKANIFSRNGNEFGIVTLFLIAFDIALFINLIIEALTVR